MEIMPNSRVAISGAQLPPAALVSLLVSPLVAAVVSAFWLQLIRVPALSKDAASNAVSLLGERREVNLVMSTFMGLSKDL